MFVQSRMGECTPVQNLSARQIPHLHAETSKIGSVVQSHAPERNRRQPSVRLAGLSGEPFVEFGTNLSDRSPHASTLCFRRQRRQSPAAFSEPAGLIPPVRAHEGAPETRTHQPRRKTLGINPRARGALFKLIRNSTPEDSSVTRLRQSDDGDAMRYGIETPTAAPGSSLVVNQGSTSES